MILTFRSYSHAENALLENAELSLNSDEYRKDIRCLWGDFLEHSSSREDKFLVQWCAVAFLDRKCLICMYVPCGIRLGDILTFRSSSVRKTSLLNSWFANTSLWGQVWTRKLSFLPGGKSGLARSGVSGLSQAMGFVASVAFWNIVNVGPIGEWSLIWEYMWCSHGKDLKHWRVIECSSMTQSFTSWWMFQSTILPNNNGVGLGGLFHLYFLEGDMVRFDSWLFVSPNKGRAGLSKGIKEGGRKLYWNGL